MFFKTLKEKCEFYRNREDDTLMPNTYVLCMLDGHSFSKVIKKRFKLPFDDIFINAMNETAAYVCSQVQGAQFAYTQSDEISILLSDFTNEKSDPFFGYRKCKLLSIIASFATAKFNRIMSEQIVNCPMSPSDMQDCLNELPLFTFDCKVWNVPTANDAFAWFLYRQNDCIRNSKQQAAQTYISHNVLAGNTTDEQIKILFDKEGIDWNTAYDNGKKYGRIIKRVETPHSIEINGEIHNFIRNAFTAVNAELFNENHDVIKSLIPELNGNDTK